MTGTFSRDGSQRDRAEGRITGLGGRVDVDHCIAPGDERIERVGGRRWLSRSRIHVKLCIQPHSSQRGSVGVLSLAHSNHYSGDPVGIVLVTTP